MTAPALGEEELAGLVARASTLSERLSGTFETDPAGGGDDAASRLLNTWREVVAGGDETLFETRLGWDGLDPRRVQSLLGSVRLAPGRAPPEWSQTVLEFAAAAKAPAADAGSGGCDFIDPADPVPFEEVLAPFVVVARDRVRALAAAGRDLLAPRAHADLERYLLRTAAFVAAQTLHLEFSVARAERHTRVAQVLAEALDPDSRVEYDAFVAEQRLDPGALLGRYPVLARLLAGVVDLWTEAVLELLERLGRDWPEIRRALGLRGEGRPLVARIEAGLSDRHRGGRSVMALTLASGERVVYKPKDVGAERAFNWLLGWLNDRGASPPFRVVRVLPRTGYGWVEFVAHEPLPDADAARRFYHRAGMLLGLVYALAGTDCHRDNLVASGEHPVLVDVESLLHPRPRPHREADGAWNLALEAMNDSVLATGMLPSWEIDDRDGGAGRPLDVSALHTPDAAELVMPTLGWERVNTDHVRPSRQTLTLPAPASQPMRGAVPLRLEDHAPDLREGFSRFYRLLLDHRAALLAEDSPLGELARQQLRFIHRNTRAYGFLHEALLHPDWLRHGADRSVQLEVLASDLVRAASVDRSRPRSWRLVLDEREQMEQLDVPTFAVRGDEDVIRLSDEAPVEGCLLESGAARARIRIAGLDAADLERQLGYIAGSLFGHVARDAVPRPFAATVERPARRHEAGDGAEGTELLDRVARDIATGVARTAILGSDGTATWIAPQYLPAVDRYQLQPIGHDLNTGASGIALFLAALEHTTGSAGHRDLALAAVLAVRRSLRDGDAGVADAMGVGGATGLGSLVYALTMTGRLLDESDLLEDARRAALLIDDERIERAPADVFSGTAGAILGLIALHQATADRAVLDRAIACGEHVLRARTRAHSGHRVWATLLGRHLTGFSHGAAGIAYALLRLHAATGTIAYRDAAAEAVEYERSLLDEAVANWPDLRVDEQPAYARAWCHGAPGIGLGRVGGLSVLDTPAVRFDIDHALRTTERLDLAGPDHLCCGNLGRGELLLVAADRLQRPELRAIVLTGAHEVVRRARRTGNFMLQEGAFRDVSTPGFLQGLSGVGYQLLRLGHPDRLPPALLWVTQPDQVAATA